MESMQIGLKSGYIKNKNELESLLKQMIEDLVKNKKLQKVYVCDK